MRVGIGVVLGLLMAGPAVGQPVPAQPPTGGVVVPEVPPEPPKGDTTEIPKSGVIRPPVSGTGTMPVIEPPATGTMPVIPPSSVPK